MSTAATMEQRIASLPQPSAARKKYLPSVPSTWAPPAASLTRIESTCPELLDLLLDSERNVDHVRAVLVEFQAQTDVMDRIDSEATRNGLLSDEVRQRKLDSAKSVIESLSCRQQLEASRATEDDAQARADNGWHPIAVEELQRAFRVLNSRGALSDDGHCAASVSSLAGVSKNSDATKWHAERRDALLKQPDVANYVQRACSSPWAYSTVMLGFVAFLIHVSLMGTFVPRLWLRMMMAPSPQRDVVLSSLSFSGACEASPQSLWCSFVSAEKLIGSVCPLSWLLDALDSSIPDVKALRFAGFLLQAVILCYTCLWWCSHTIRIVSCELMSETCGWLFAADTKPSHNGSLQSLRLALKHVTCFAINSFSVSGASYEYATLGHLGHLECIGGGELTQAHFHFVQGRSCRAAGIDGALTQPHHMLLQQRRWVSVLQDKYGVPMQSFPELLLKGGRVRQFVSKSELLREEHRLRTTCSEQLGQDGSILDASTMAEYFASEVAARKAAVDSGDSLEIQYGAERRAMLYTLLFYKEHYKKVRAASIADLKTVADRLNFPALDPRPLKSLCETEHPSISTTFYQAGLARHRFPECIRKHAKLSLCLRDSAYLAWCYAAHTMNTTLLLAVCGACVATYTIACLRLVLPMYHVTLGKVVGMFGRWYQRDNFGMFIDTDSCLLACRVFALLHAQGLRVAVAFLFWTAVVFVPVLSALSNAGESVTGYSNALCAAVVALVVALVCVLAELLSRGFLWHPIWFVQACGHMKMLDSVGASRSTEETSFQPSVSLYSIVWFILLTGETLQVEQHDFPRLPWFARDHLRRLAPSFYDPLHSYSALLGAVNAYVCAQGDGVYAPMSNVGQSVG